MTKILLALSIAALAYTIAASMCDDIIAKWRIPIGIVSGIVAFVVFCTMA